MKSEAGEDVAKPIHRTYRSALGLTATAARLADTRPVVAKHCLSALFRAHLDSSEFLFVP